MVSIFLFVQRPISQRALCACVSGVCGDQDSHLSGFVPARTCLDGNPKTQCWACFFYLIFISEIRDHILCSHKCKMMYLKRLKDNEENVKLNKNAISFICLEKTQSWTCCFYELVIKCSWCLSIL